MFANLGKPKRSVLKFGNKILCQIHFCNIIISSGSYSVRIILYKQNGPNNILFGRLTPLSFNIKIAQMGFG